MENKLKSLSRKEYQNVSNDAFRIIKSTFVSRTKKFDGKSFIFFENDNFAPIVHKTSSEVYFLDVFMSYHILCLYRNWWVKLSYQSV